MEYGWVQLLTLTPRHNSVPVAKSVLALSHTTDRVTTVVIIGIKIILHSKNIIQYRVEGSRDHG